MGRRTRIVALLSALATTVALTAPSAPLGAQATPTAGKPAGVLSEKLQAVADEASGGSVQAQAQAAQVAPTGPGSLLRHEDGRLLVDIDVAAATILDSAALAAAGAEVTAVAEWATTATVAVAASDLAALAAVPGVRTARDIPAPLVGATTGSAAEPDPGPSTNAVCGDRVVSEADTDLRAALARSSFGVDGSGVKVGILSDSYNRLGRASVDVAEGELPGPGNPCGRLNPVQVLKDHNASTDSDEGRAMAQLVHDLAPGASLLFATAYGGPIDFGNQIRALAAAGATVIVDDISYFDEPMYQDGVIAKAVNDVTAQGVSYFSSAANSHSQIGSTPVGSYSATYRAASCPSVVGATLYGTCHDFNTGAGVDTTDQVRVPSGASVDAILGWNQPQNGVTTDYDIFLLDTAGNLLAGSAAANLGGQPFEYFSWVNTSGSARDVRVVVNRYEGAAAPRFKIVFSRAQFTQVEYTATTGGDIVGPTSFGHNMMRAGASVAATEWGSGQVETFSSRGPASYCWNPVAGSGVASAISPCQAKTIDFTASDGTSTTVEGFEAFYGTSAAAPHAAAVAALFRQARPCRTNAQVLAALRTGSDTLGFPADAQGAGRIDAYDVIAENAACANAAPAAPGTPVVSAAGRDSLTVTWTAPLPAPPVTGYSVLVYVNGSLASTIPTGTTATSRALTGLPAGAEVQVRVRATNTVGTGPQSGASAPALLPFRSFDAFTTQQFKDFAGRTPTSAELADWRTALNGATTGAQRINTAGGFQNWGPKVDPVTRLYYAFFDRVPDTDGLNYWAGQLRAGRSLNTTANQFTGTPEFKNTYGPLNNSQFVDLVYQNVLGRAPDADGLAYWTAELNSGRRNRGTVMTGFSEAQEHRTRRAGEVNTVNTFLGMIRRAPTAAEVTTWKPQAQSSRTAVAAFLLGSLSYDLRV